MTLYTAAKPGFHSAGGSAPAPAIPYWRATYVGYAGFALRAAAYIVDTIVITVLAVVIGTLLQDTTPRLIEWLAFRGEDQRFNTLWFVVAALYFVGLEATGATPGKRLVQLRVIQQTGEPMTFRASLIRNILRPVDLFLFGLVGYIVMSQSVQNQRLGDLAARTVVVLRRSP